MSSRCTDGGETTDHAPDCARFTRRVNAPTIRQVTTERYSSWFRADDIGMQGTLVRGGVTIALGATLLLLTGLSERLHFSSGVRITCTIVGSGALLFGLVTGFVTLPRFLFVDHYVAIGETSLHLSLQSGQKAVPWEDIARIYERDGSIIIEHKESEEHAIARTFGGKTAKELAPLLNHARLKAIMKMPSRSTSPTWP